ncbi:MAG: YbaK/EbsC family protein [Anaerolineales bacterium]|jgi:Ala-tRNA(Pro) deacylase|nr:YbaK/EbsC family protein [Anaerolineales bacterium]
MDNSTPVTIDLSSKKIPYRVFRHPGPIHSLEQAAQERGQEPGQVIRSILFRISQDNYVMVLVAGPKQVSWQALRGYLGQSRLTMASKEDVLAVTGYQLGAVSPFGLPQPLRVLVDRNVFFPDEVSIGSGVRGVSVIIKASDLKKALGEVEVGHFVKD